MYVRNQVVNFVGCLECKAGVINIALRVYNVDLYENGQHQPVVSRHHVEPYCSNGVGMFSFTMSE